MTKFVLDLRNYKDRMGARVAEGRYRVIVEDAEMDKSKANNPMINMWYRILTPGEYEGLTLIDRLTLTEKAYFRIVGFMQAVGLPTPKKAFEIDLERQFIGKVLDVDVEDGEPYNGRVKSEVRGYLRASGVVQANTASSTDIDDIDLDNVPDDLVVEGVVPDDVVTEPEPPAAQPTPIRPAAATVAEPEAVDLDTLDLA